VIIILVPVQTKNELNASRCGWRAKHERRKAVKEAVTYSLLGVADWNEVGKPSASNPWLVRLVRLTPYEPRMDDDGVVSSLKSCRDAIAKFVGVDDKHRHIIRYEYDQSRGDINGVRVEIRAVEAA
jgi:hypothetical protein